MTALRQSVDRLSTKGERLIDIKQSFFHSVLYGFGVVIGSTFIAVLLLYLFSFIDTAPIIGDYVAKIIKVVQQHSSS